MAGLHVAGSIGAIEYLISHLPNLYEKIGTQNFSMLIDSKMDELGNFNSTAIGEAMPL